MNEVAEGQEVQGLLIPQRQIPLLLPSAAVIEIIGFRELTPGGDQAPGWLLGYFEWRHMDLPLVSMERLLGVRREKRRGRRRIILVHVFSDALEHPFMGIEATGMPRLVNVNADNLSVEYTEWPRDWPILYKVKIQETEALVPDLDRLGALMAELEAAEHA